MQDRLPKTLPFKLNKYKGASLVFINYNAVQFIINNTRNISKSLSDSLAPFTATCESFFQVLQFNPQVMFPGGMWRHPEDGLYTEPKLNRHKEWVIEDETKCVSGFVQRGICMLGVKHLSHLVNHSYGTKLIANKFPWQFQPMALDCLHAWHDEKVIREYRSRKTNLDISQFINNSYVKFARTVPGF